MIVVTNRQRVRKINARLLKQMAGAVLAELDIPQAQLGIVLVGAKESALLNEEFLRHAGPTDVITFDYRGAPSAGAASKPRAAGPRAPGSPRPARRAGTGAAAAIPRELHGEIFVCVDEAERQANQFGTTWREEIARYVAHGILHLAGHDDLEAADRRKMKRAEGRLVRELCRRFALSKL